MADQAYVYVQNDFKNEIEVCRKDREGAKDLKQKVAHGNKQQIYLVGSGVSLDIYAPPKTDTKKYPLKVKSDVDLSILYSRTESTWTIGIKSNDLPPETPTTVNVTVGSEEPD